MPLRLIAFLVLTFFMTISAHADNSPGDAQTDVHFDCSPSDGPAIRFLISSSNKGFDLYVYSEALEQLNHGIKTIKHDVYVCPNSDFKDYSHCSVQDALVEFDTLDMRVGGTARGTLKLDGGDKVPFSGTIAKMACCCG